EMLPGHRGQAAAVRTPDDALDDGYFVGFLLQLGGEFSEGRHIPEPNRAVPGGRSDLRAVGTETRVVDVAGVAAQPVAGLRLLQVPEADGAVMRCRGEHVPMRIEGETIDVFRVAVQDRHGIAARRLPGRPPSRDARDGPGPRGAFRHPP